MNNCEHVWEKSLIQQRVAFCCLCGLDLPLEEVCEHKIIVEVIESSPGDMNGLEHPVPACFDCHKDMSETLLQLQFK